MLDNLFALLKGEIIKADNNKIRKLDKNKDYLLLQDDGNTEWLGGEPEDRNHQAHDTQTIADFATKNNGAAVWYSRERIVCLLDDATRKDRVTLPLAYSQQLLTLSELEKSKKSLNQRDVIFLLRTMFADCLGPAGNIIDLLRKIQWKVSTGGESEIQKGKSSLGKSITQEVYGKDILPDYVTLSVPVFAQHLTYLMHDVKCVIEPNEQTQSFQLFPLPGWIEAAIAAAEIEVGKALRELLATAEDSDDVATPIYYGIP